MSHILVWYSQWLQDEDCVSHPLNNWAINFLFQLPTWSQCQYNPSILERLLHVTSKVAFNLVGSSFTYYFFTACILPRAFILWRYHRGPFTQFECDLFFGNFRSNTNVGFWLTDNLNILHHFLQKSSFIVVFIFPTEEGIPYLYLVCLLCESHVNWMYVFLLCSTVHSLI